MSAPVFTTVSWWKAASIRALRTALVIAVPYVPVSYLGEIPYLVAASAAGLGFLLSLLTSLAGLAEVAGDKQPWFYAILSRVVKTVAQALVAGLGAAVLIEDVDFAALGALAITAGFGSLLLAVLSTLPEADKPLASASISTTVLNSSGNTSFQSVPITTTITNEQADISVSQGE